MTDETSDRAPRYLAGDDLERVARMQTELLSELWILRDRVQILEHLLAEAGVVAPDAIDSFQPDAAFDEQLRADRDALVGRVIGAGRHRPLDLDEIRRRARPDDKA